MNTLLDGDALGALGAVLQIGLGVWLQSGILLALGLLAGETLFRRRAAARAFLYRATLLAVMLVGLLSVTLAGRHPTLWLIALPSPAETAVGGVSSEDGVRSTEATRATNGAVAVQPHSPSTSLAAEAASEPIVTSGGLYALALGLWAGGALLLMGWLFFCQICIARLRARSIPVTDGEAALLLTRLCQLMRLQQPPLLSHPGVRSPFLTGLRCPAILLPSAYEREFDATALDALFTHELTHLARRDCGWKLVARLACALLWVQPLLWALGRRMEHTAEEVCDQVVTEQVCPPREYARFLLRLSERWLPSAPECAAGMGMMPSAPR